MTRYANNRNTSIEPILKAAEEWKRNCLIDGKSVFQPGLRLWTEENISELAQMLDNSGGQSSTNVPGELETRLASASAELKKLAAEVFWLQYLSLYENPTWQNKKNMVLQIWGWSGDKLEEGDPKLAEELLCGVGRTGTMFHTRPWYEFQYSVSVCEKISALGDADKKELLDDGFKFSEWLTHVSGSDTFQMRHILLFLLFPEEMDRVYSNGQRRFIAETLNPKVPSENIRGMLPHELDRLLFETRKRLEVRYKTDELDWYDPPLVSLWRKKFKNRHQKKRWRQA